MWEISLTEYQVRYWINKSDNSSVADLKLVSVRYNWQSTRLWYWINKTDVIPLWWSQTSKCEVLLTEYQARYWINKTDLCLYCWPQTGVWDIYWPSTRSDTEWTSSGGVLSFNIFCYWFIVHSLTSIISNFWNSWLCKNWSSLSSMHTCVIGELLFYKYSLCLASHKRDIGKQCRPRSESVVFLFKWLKINGVQTSPWLSDTF